MHEVEGLGPKSIEIRNLPKHSYEKMAKGGLKPLFSALCGKWRIKKFFLKGSKKMKGNEVTVISFLLW